MNGLEYQKKVEEWKKIFKERGDNTKTTLKKSVTEDIKKEEKNDSKSSIDMTEFLEKAGHFAIHHYGKEIGDIISKIIGIK